MRTPYDESEAKTPAEEVTFGWKREGYLRCLEDMGELVKAANTVAEMLFVRGKKLGGATQPLINALAKFEEAQK